MIASGGWFVGMCTESPKEMSEIVITSDSDDSICATQIVNRTSALITKDTAKKRLLSDGSTSDDFDFPEVQFCYATDTDQIASSQDHDRYNELSDNELNAELDKFCSIPSTSGSNTQTNNAHYGYSTHGMSDSSESENETPLTCIEDVVKDIRPIEEKDKNKKTRRIAVNKEERIKRKDAKQKVQGNSQREKMLKEVAARKLRNAKGDEPLKFMEVILDEGMKDSIYFNETVTMLQRDNIRYSTHSQLVPNSVTWKRTREDYVVTDNNEIKTVSDTQTEDHIIVILNWFDAVEKVTEDTLDTFVSSVKTIASNCDVTLVIFGIEDYFKYWKKHKSNAKGSRSQPSQQSFATAPKITKDQLDISLVRVQIMQKCNNRIIDTPEDMALMIYTYTKSIAQRPYKLEKQKEMEDKLEWYMMIDETDTVKVDKDGNGLKKVWQRQLCDFNHSSLEVAEAICSIYPSPALLIEAYKNCTPEEGVNLLKDIPIRRAAGPLTTARKVGPELSKKIYIMFTATDGETLL